MLVEREQLGGEHVVHRHHRHADREHVDLLAAAEHLVVHLEALGVEDQVHEHVAVPGLEQPALGRALGAHARGLEQLERALRVLRLDHDVEVVVGFGAAARPVVWPG